MHTALGIKPALAKLEGAYVWRDDLKRYDYSAKAALEKVLSAWPPEVALLALIDCLDDTSASASVVDGQPVAVGIVCYQGLAQLAYHEPVDEGGDVAASWPGVVSPKASAQDMRRAKAAWKAAHDARLLIFQ